MRRAGLILAVVAGALLGTPAAPAAAAASTVDVLVAGQTRTLEPGAEVRLRDRRVRVGGRRCTVGARTPLAALLGTGLRVSLKDFGSCGRSARDAGGLFVRQVGPDRNRGDSGWFYKVGRRAGTASAGDASGAFGDGRRLRPGQRVTWFWCDASATGECQRTLEVVPATPAVAPGGALRVTVRGYDNQGRGAPVGGATVRLGEAAATTAADGTATLTAPAGPGRLELTAERAGMVRAFPRDVAVR